MSITLCNERQKWFGWALVVLFFFCSGDAAAKEYGGAQEVTTTECLPSSLVNQNVCAITGEYVISATHLVLQGPEPLTIGRTYTNRKLKSWDLNHRDAILTSSADIKDRSHKIMRVIQPSGTKLDYKCLKKTFSGREPSSFHMVVPKGLLNLVFLVSIKKTKDVNDIKDENDIKWEI